MADVYLTARLWTALAVAAFLITIRLPGGREGSRVHEYLVGATTDRVAHLAPCSVLVVR